MKIDLKLPQIITVDDYHEFEYLADFLRGLNKNIKVSEFPDGVCVDEVRHLYGHGYYVGCVYTNKRDFERLMRKIGTLE